ncbi:Coiled-coil-helix-coiled-coil-helix domain-containing protein 7 [Habropoda laboriosa]|uniref:Coiled-coil-helix-coiled-coil-helix domain-containing protein 7 n=1 Tax=Habropoda laboriosa TaxID=597456 RepID=A0A0L7R0P7_9HYME|nr:Coiled-coil-helix-coiled-coil-helix domain-containing protein 7 [Habropoda laboriosa]
MTVSNNNNTKASDLKKKLKRDQELYNPCFKEYNISLKCLEMNKYNYDVCEAHFENYRICKKFWGKVISLRIFNNITPHVPLPEDRERLKAEYIHSRKFS